MFRDLGMWSLVFRVWAHREKGAVCECVKGCMRSYGMFTERSKGPCDEVLGL